MLNRRGAMTDPCGMPFLRRRNLLLCPFPVVRVKLRLLTISVIMWTICLSGSNRSSLQVRHGAIQCCKLLWVRQTKHRPSFSLKSYRWCPVSAGWPDLWLTSRVGSPTAPVGTVGQWLFRHKCRWVSRGF